MYLATPLQEYLQPFDILIPGDWPSQFYQRQLAYNEPPGDLGAPFKNTVATMGPLHVSLNGQENVVLKFIDFFKPFYHHLFGKQLANKPEPWRITLMLELLYGGWTLIRQPVLARLQRFKDLQVCTLLNLVDNYVPLTLSRRVAHIGSKVRTNPPLFAKFRFFFLTCSLYGRALSCHHTTSLHLKQRNLVERGVDCQSVHDGHAVGVGTTSTRG